MPRYNLLLAMVIIIVNCSSQVSMEHLSSKISETGVKSQDQIYNEQRGEDDGFKDKSDPEDEEEEIVAVPPTIISGAYLACSVESIEAEFNGASVSCFLMRDDKVIKSHKLLDSDISVLDREGHEIVKEGFRQTEDGLIEFDVIYPPGVSGIEVHIQSIQGEALEGSVRPSQLSLEPEGSGGYEERRHRPRHSGEGDAQVEGQSESSGQAQSSGANNTTLCDELIGDWVLVPGNSAYNTNDFCVMKYEVKCFDSDGRNCFLLDFPESKPGGKPWVFINQREAKDVCASLGNHYYLINNREWMTIGSNALEVASNWSTGAIGSGWLARGHSDNNPSRACEADANDSNAYVDGNCLGSDMGDYSQKRTLELTNGAFIWDFSGNAFEWVDFNERNSKAAPAENIWIELTDITGSSNMGQAEIVPRMAREQLWNSEQGLGRYYPGPNGEGGALYRGGSWNSEANAGIFSAGLDKPSWHYDDSIGFRCIYDLQN